MLTKDQILKADDLKREKVNVPEWGGDVLVRGMTAKERDDYRRDLDTGRDKQCGASALFAIRMMIDADGKRLFFDGDAPALAAKSAGALDKVLEVAFKLSGIGDSEVKELEKN